MNQDYKEILKRLEEQVGQVEEVIQPLEKVSSVFELKEGKSDLEQAKTFVSLSYALASSLFSYLKLNAVDTNDHPIMVELQRLKQYAEKIRKVEQKQNHSEQDQRPPVSMAVADRVVRQHIRFNGKNK
ncbi:substrate-specific nuclear cofactor for exosome activity [Schizosaccharomyces japonicus yFS275]|uniref:Exosome complex protein n=1 Tax=Schizosaccharomyces japonicus (strain yFS275 / FY16936) TaxID=402676 RepID=B6K002_SCHJY|nr:substrate-specific nuclear cofactor for exosome activity [Schizosaccharomyces japonicus yFS275]EEB06152.1 substrate-specific nuclear cofactor for exosome activity [Schizosaccharomyces japonicus yFS275]